MNSKVWSSRADVLNDLKEVTGGNTGISDLDNFVAFGERPPPNRRESVDEDELRAQFGVFAPGMDNNNAPDLDGIAQMLQLVNEDSHDNEPTTIFRNTATDEITISKLNPNVSEFVPSAGSSSVRRKPHLKQKSPRKNKFNSPKKLDQDIKGNKVEAASSDKEKEKADIPDHILNEKKNNMVSKNVSNKVEANNNKEKEKADIPDHILNEKKNNVVSKNVSDKANASGKDISLDKKVDVSNLKPEQIEEMKVKIKSKIINSSGDTIEVKKQKNVAIAALLRLYTAPAEEPPKLITPDYFEVPPAKTVENEPEKDLTGSVEPIEQPRGNRQVYRDPFVEESIAKVNDWFDNADDSKPKPKPLPVPPVAAPTAPVPAPAPLPPSQFRNALTFKKKCSSTLSINSPKSETSSEKKKQTASFVPSSYANDLLQKYENNVKKEKGPKEDWRDALERQLLEKDELIRKKMREKQEATSPSSGRGN